MIKRYGFLFLLVWFLAGCETPASPPAATTAVAATDMPAVTATTAVVALVPTETAIPPTSTTAVEPPTVTPVVTEAPAVTAAATVPTAVGTADGVMTDTAVSTATATMTVTAAATPPLAATMTATVPTETAAVTATIAPPPSDGNVTQPPYAASDCSDKYPCNDDIAAWEARIRVPAGFTDTYFARVTGRPTSLAFGPDGLLYVAVQEGTIYTIDQSGGIGTYASGFNTPTGIAFRPGTSSLYVSSRVLNENVGGEAQVSIANGPQVVGGLPCCYTFLHAANGIAFGSDGWGYVSVGGRADHGEILDGTNAQDERHPLEASILRFNPDSGAVEVYARGFRNSYDLAWDANGQLYATDNAPDYGPPEEFHRVVPGGEHGYPWYDCGTCFQPPEGIEVIPPIYQFVSHSAPTGVTAYLADQFPGYYNSLFVTLWSAFPGAQKVMRFGPGGVGASDFATGFAAPIDVTVGPDGRLYIADWATGIIFQIGYTG